MGRVYRRIGRVGSDSEIQIEALRRSGSGEALRDAKPLARETDDGTRRSVRVSRRERADGF
jgi:hypothetical protein